MTTPRSVLMPALILALAWFAAVPAMALDEQYIGEIRMFAGNFAPRGWRLCNGESLPINQNQALFAVIGITYGGDGKTDFALPDLRGRVPVHSGQGAGLTMRVLGHKGGAEKKSPLAPPAAVVKATEAEAARAVQVPATAPVVETMPPFLSINFIIAVEGVFPDRD